MEQELKPCPFCGGDANIVSREEGITFITCKDCYAEMFGSTKESAIKQWNTRVSE